MEHGDGERGLRKQSMQGDDDSGDELQGASGRRETLAHLVPRVVVRATFFAKELGPVRGLAVRDGCVVVLFDGGVELQFHGDGALWSGLLAKAHAGELVLSGDAEDAWNEVKAEVERRRAVQ